ncbi:MAG: PfkB family carbohydrate kinase [bacterium]
MKLQTTHKPHIAVVGGACVEMSFSVPSFPSQGETVYSRALLNGPGGRAIAVASDLAALGCRVFFLSSVGLDQTGSQLIADLQARRVNVDHVERVENARTDVTHSLRDEQGGGARVISGGVFSNMSRTPLFSARALISACELMIVAPDIPEDTFKFAVDMAHHYGVPVMALASPPDRLPAALIPQLDALIVNAAEALALTHIKADSLDGANEALNFLLKRGAGSAAIYLGRQGAAASSALRASLFFPPPMSKIPFPADSEDAFAAGLAFALTSGAPLPEAVTFAVANSFATAAAGSPAKDFPTQAAVSLSLKINYDEVST